jgi:hypothetical protein
MFIRSKSAIQSVLSQVMERKKIAKQFQKMVLISSNISPTVPGSRATSFLFAFTIRRSNRTSLLMLSKFLFLRFYFIKNFVSSPVIVGFKINLIFCNVLIVCLLTSGNQLNQKS